MVLRINRRNLIKIALLITTFSNSQFLMSRGLDNPILYIGFAILLYLIYFKSFKWKREKKRFLLFCTVSILFSIGIILQDMNNTTKMRLVISMLIISSTAILSYGVMNSLYDLRAAVYGILDGLVLVLILSIITGTSVTSGVTEGLVAFGFSGGMEHKNVLGMDLFAIISGLMIYRKFYKKLKSDFITIIISLLFLALSHARVAWLLFIIFVLLLNLDEIKKISKRQRKVIIPIIFIVGIVLAVFLFRYLNSNSVNMAIRVQGLINWINYFNGDRFHLLFGNAALAWADTGYGYVENVRRVTGWNGTLEMGILGVLVKNGILGLVGYALIYIYYVKCARVIKNIDIKVAAISLIIVAIFSMVTESFMINTAVVYGTYMYLTISSLICEKTTITGKSINNRYKLSRGSSR